MNVNGVEQSYYRNYATENNNTNHANSVDDTEKTDEFAVNKKMSVRLRYLSG